MNTIKDYRFYAELPDNRASKSASKHHQAFTIANLRNMAARGVYVNCLAVPLENGRPMYQGNTMRFDVIGAVIATSNSIVGGASADAEYLRKRCVRVPESLARQLHPNLFSYLEDNV